MWLLQNFALYWLQWGCLVSRKDYFWRNINGSVLQIQDCSYTLATFLINVFHLVLSSLPNPKPLSSSLSFPKLFLHPSQTSSVCIFRFSLIIFILSVLRAEDFVPHIDWVSMAVFVKKISPSVHRKVHFSALGV